MICNCEKIAKNKFSVGHKFPGRPGKTAFPKSWSEEKIMHEISDVVTDPNLKWIPKTGNGASLTRARKPAKFVVEGILDGVRIHVVVKPAIDPIVTGFPLDGVGVTFGPLNI